MSRHSESQLLWNILLVILLVAVNGFFVAAEFALVKVRASELKAPDGKATGRMRQASRMLERLDVYLSACQLGITLASLGLGWVGEPLIAKMLEPVFAHFGLAQDKVHFAAFPLAFLIITFLHLTVGEQAPKIGAIQRARATTLFVAYPLAVFYRIFKPFIGLINYSSNGLLRLVGLKSVTEHDQVITEDEVRLILTQSASMGHLGAGERRILENVLDMEDKIGRRYMLRRSEIVYLDRGASIQSQLKIASSSGHTRFPLCDGDLDSVVGTIHVKDIFNATSLGKELTSLTEVAREALFLPETIHLDALLKEFQKAKKHMAILVDEYGSTSGIITLENVIEEMVGQIEDEFDAETPLAVSKGDNRFEMDAAYPIDDFVQKFGITLPDGSEADSLGGLLIEMLSRIPRRGEKIQLGRCTITVLESEPTRAVRLLVEHSPVEDREQ